MQGLNLARRVCSQLLSMPQVARQKFILRQMGTVHVVERVRSVNLYEEDKNPRLRGKHYIYRSIENPNLPPKEIEVLLTDNVDGLGIVGDVVKVPKRLWRNFLSQARLATYPTPENIAELNKELQNMGENTAVLKKLGKYSRITLQKVRGLNVPVELLPSKKGWTLTKSHLRVALRKVGISATEDSITLPEDPHIEKPGEFIFTLTMNDVVSLKVRATLVEPPLVYTEESPADKVQKWNNPPVTPDEELDPIIRKFITMPAIDLDSLMKRPSRKKVKNFIKG